MCVRMSAVPNQRYFFIQTRRHDLASLRQLRMPIYTVISRHVYVEECAMHPEEKKKKTVVASPVATFSCSQSIRSPSCVLYSTRHYVERS